MVSFWLVIIMITESGSYFKMVDTYTTLKECRAVGLQAPEHLKNKVACLPVLNYYPKDNEKETDNGDNSSTTRVSGN